MPELVSSTGMLDARAQELEQPMRTRRRSRSDRRGKRQPIFMSAGDVFLRTLEATDKAYDEYKRIREKQDLRREEDLVARHARSVAPCSKREQELPSTMPQLPLRAARGRGRLLPPVASEMLTGPSKLQAAPEPVPSSVRAPWTQRVPEGSYIEGVRLMAVQSFRELQARRANDGAAHDGVPPPWMLPAAHAVARHRHAATQCTITKSHSTPAHLSIAAGARVPGR